MNISFTHSHYTFRNSCKSLLSLHAAFRDFHNTQGVPLVYFLHYVIFLFYKLFRPEKAVFREYRFYGKKFDFRRILPGFSCKT